MDYLALLNKLIDGTELLCGNATLILQRDGSGKFSLGGNLFLDFADLEECAFKVDCFVSQWNYRENQQKPQNGRYQQFKEELYVN